MKRVKSLRKDGLFAYQCGHYPDAERIYLQALKKLPSVKGNDIAPIQLRYDLFIDLSDTFRVGGQLDPAQNYCDQAEEIAEQLQDQVRLANAIECRAKIKTLKEMYDEALEDLNKSLQVKLQQLDGNSQEIANCYDAMSTNYHKQRKTEFALSLAEKSLNIRQQIFGDNHVDTAVSYSNVAQIYFDQCKFDDALTMHQKASRIKLQL